MSYRRSRRRWGFFVLAVWLLSISLAGLASASSHAFTITSPSSSSVWYPGSTVTITWTGGSTSTLVNLSLVDVPAWTVAMGIAAAIPNNGSYTWTVPSTLPPGTYLVYIENVERTVWAYGENFPVNQADGKFDLSIAKKPDGPLQAGQNGAYVLMVTNVGTGPAAGPITVTDTLGPGLSHVPTAGGPGWTCTVAGQTVTCVHPGPLPAGASLPALTIPVTVAKDARKVENCASVSTGKEQDPNPENNRTCVGTVTVLPQTGSICGVKFDDKDGDGIRDPGEAGLPGWTIVLEDPAGNMVASAVTGLNGEYCFTGLPMGTYTVSEVQQPGWQQTAPTTGTFSLGLTAEKPDIKPVDFGNQVRPQPGVICGVKFNDLNGNGVQDAGEPGLPGWTMQMTDAAGNPVATVVTGPGGRFCFRQVKPGTYTFNEVMQAN